MKKFITLLLVLTGMVSTAYAGAQWIGNSYINVNTIWYQASGTEDWASGGAFNNLGSITSLSIGGQLQIGDNGNNWKGGAGDWMHYVIDEDQTSEIKGDINLSYEGYGYGQYNNNMRFQSGGGSFSASTIDISSLSLGEHTLKITFGPIDNVYEAGSPSYAATFTKVADISGATVTGINSPYEWRGSAINPVPTVTLDETVLSSSTDYTVSYSAGCTNAGNYSVTITGKGNYIGSKVVNFTINPGYYVAGIGGSWAINPNYRLSKFDADQYVIRDLVMHNGDGIKVVSSNNGSDINTYYPGDGGNKSITEDNSYTIFFRPDYGGGNDWYYKTFYVDLTTSVDVPLAPNGYGTYYNSVCGVTLPTGAKAYILKDEKPTYEMIADGDDDGKKTVPAGTAILLSGSSSVTLALSTSITGSVAGNKLQGSDVRTTTTGGSVYYKLTYGSALGHESQFGWYYGADGGAAFDSPAHKAWLALPAAASRSFFGLPDDDNTTGISSVESKQQDVNSVWYDLNGRRVIAPTSKGIYVKDGRKVVIK